MANEIERNQIISLVQKISNAEGSEEELYAMMDNLVSSVPHPNVIDLIFDADTDLTAEQIADIALNYQPTQL